MREYVAIFLAANDHLESKLEITAPDYTDALMQAQAVMANMHNEDKRLVLLSEATYYIDEDEIDHSLRDACGGGYDLEFKPFR